QKICGHNPRGFCLSGYSRLVALGKRQQSDVPRLFNGPGDAPLMRGANSGKAARNNLAAFRYKTLQQTHIAIWNRVNLFDAELAYFLAAEKLTSTRTRSARSGGARGSPTTSGRRTFMRG